MARRKQRRGGRLARISVADLNAELARRRGQAGALQRHHDELAAELDGLRADLEALGSIDGAVPRGRGRGGRRGPGRPPGRRRRGRNKTTLVEALAAALKGKTLSIADAIAAVNRDKPEVDILDVQSGAILTTLRAPGEIRRIAWRPDGESIAGASLTTRLYLWKLATGQARELVGHTAEATRISFSHNGRLLLSDGWDGMIRLWDAGTGQLLSSLPGELSGGFSRDDRFHGFTRKSVLGVLEIDGADECRTLRAHPSAYKSPDRLSTDRGGRFLASAGTDGARLWDLQTGKELAFLALGHVRAAVLLPAGDGLVTVAPTGMHLWPIQAAEGVIRIGPARTLWAQRALRTAMSSADARLMVVISGDDQATVLPLDDPRRQLLLRPHNSVSHAYISPDGRWVATGAFAGWGVRVWNAADGTLAADLTATEGASPEVALKDASYGIFSPNGRWLITTSARQVSFWEVGTWERRRSLLTLADAGVPSVIAFSGDSATFAAALGRQVVKLVDAASLEELATFEVPEGERATEVLLSPDGTRLVIATDANRIRIWDLRRVRERLARMGMDWNAPSFPVEPPAARTPPPVRVEIDLGDATPAAGSE